MIAQLAGISPSKIATLLSSGVVYDSNPFHGSTFYVLPSVPQREDVIILALALGGINGLTPVSVDIIIGAEGTSDMSEAAKRYARSSTVAFSTRYLAILVELCLTDRKV